MFVRLVLLFSAMLTFSLAAQEETPPPPAGSDAPPVPEVKKTLPLIKAGTVVSAAMLSEKPAIDAPYGDQKNSSPCWIEVTVKPDAGRSVSIHDYVLTADGSEYPCVAVALDTEAYSGTVWKLEQLDGSKNFRLLFPVPSKDASYRIKFKLLSTALPAAKLEFPAPASENPQESAPENP